MNRCKFLVLPVQILAEVKSDFKMTKQIYIIHENDEWVVPLREELKKINASYKEWHMGRDKIDSSNIPPNGVFYNRMSASSHTRGHRYAPEDTKVVLNWLENHNQRIINNSKALKLEISKQNQYQEMKKNNIRFLALKLLNYLLFFGYDFLTNSKLLLYPLVHNDALLYVNLHSYDYRKHHWVEYLKNQFCLYLYAILCKMHLFFLILPLMEQPSYHSHELYKFVYPFQNLI